MLETKALEASLFTFAAAASRRSLDVAGAGLTGGGEESPGVGAGELAGADQEPGGDALGCQAADDPEAFADAAGAQVRSSDHHVDLDRVIAVEGGQGRQAAEKPRRLGGDANLETAERCERLQGGSGIRVRLPRTGDRTEDDGLVSRGRSP